MEGIRIACNTANITNRPFFLKHLRLPSSSQMLSTYPCHPFLSYPCLHLPIYDDPPNTGCSHPKRSSSVLCEDSTFITMNCVFCIMSQRVSKKPEKILSVWGSFHLHLDNTHTSRHTHTHPYPWASLEPYIERALDSSHHSFVLETTGPMVLLSDKRTLHYISCLFPLISSKSIPSPLSLHNGLLLASLSDSVST